MNTKSLEQVMERVREVDFRESFDLVVAVANGGIIPAALVNQRLGLEMQLLRVSLRDPNQKPMYDAPKLMAPVGFEVKDKTILLVEDRVKTGASLELARKTLLEAGAREVKTLAVNGPADYPLYDEACFRFPWIL